MTPSAELSLLLMGFLVGSLAMRVWLSPLFTEREALRTMLRQSLRERDRLEAALRQMPGREPVLRVRAFPPEPAWCHCGHQPGDHLGAVGTCRSDCPCAVYRPRRA